jgi:hypothetical protein
MNTDPNNQHKILWWIVGALLGPIILAVFGNLMNTILTTTQRTSVLETHWHEVDRRMHRMEHKLDQLLDR